MCESNVSYAHTDIYDKKVLAKRNGILYLPIGVRSCVLINTNSTT